MFAKFPFALGVIVAKSLKLAPSILLCILNVFVTCVLVVGIVTVICVELSATNVGFVGIFGVLERTFEISESDTSYKNILFCVVSTKYASPSNSSGLPDAYAGFVVPVELANITS